MPARGMERRVGVRGEQKRRWDRENLATCACGKPMKRSAVSCMDCRRVKRDVRWATIAMGIKAGKTHVEIAESLGYSCGTIGSEVKRMRKAGWDLGPVRLGRPPKRV